MAEKLAFLGGGGHARVLLSLASALGHRVVGVCDPKLSGAGTDIWLGVPVLGGDDSLISLDPGETKVVVAIGQMPGSTRRRDAFLRAKALGFNVATLVHPAAWVADDVVLAEGVQVMAGAVIQPGCVIGRDTIVNTRAGVDHDCKIGAHAHVAPGATICGDVSIGDGSFIGAGATLIQGVQVGAGTLVRAGSTVINRLDQRT